MKKHLLFLFAALLPLLASAEKVEIDGIWYNLVSKAKQAEVTKSGGTEYSGSITIPATVTHNGVAYSVTSIGEGAFGYCSSLTAITIPESVTSIEEYAFYKCTSLTTINIPESVTSIGDYAFQFCSSLTAINIPEGVTSIGEGAFDDCSSLTAINIPEGVTSIGELAFHDCSSLTTITIPESVTSIGDRAFSSCSSLTAVHISSIEAWCKISFDFSSNPLAYAHNLYLNGELVTELVIPEGVTSIGNYAFSGCSSLTAINIPEGVTSIGGYAFCGCSSLTAITISEGVTSIGQYAFSECSSLTTIVLPKSVKDIYGKAFANCPELLDVYCYAEKVPSTKSDAFDGSYPEYATLHVPASAIDDYKSSSPWSDFGTIKTIENVTLEKCATPTISYVDGKVMFACDTEEAIIKSNIKENIAGDYNDMEVAFIPTYTITAYATKANHEDSDAVTLTICWVPCTEEHEDGNTDSILTIPAKPVLISTQGGILTLSGLADGTEVAAYSTAGMQLATATATNSTATLTTGLEAGSIAIVKIGNYSIKVAIK